MFSAADLTSNPLLVALVSVSFSLVVGLLAWIVRELSRITASLNRQEERSEDHERRLNRLEDRV